MFEDESGISLLPSVRATWAPRGHTEQVWGSLKSAELANLCADTIGQVAEIAEDGLDRIGSDASLCFAFLRHAGLPL